MTGSKLHESYSNASDTNSPHTAMALVRVYSSDSSKGEPEAPLNVCHLSSSLARVCHLRVRSFIFMFICVLTLALKRSFPLFFVFISVSFSFVISINVFVFVESRQ